MKIVKRNRLLTAGSVILLLILAQFLSSHSERSLSQDQSDDQTIFNFTSSGVNQSFAQTDDGHGHGHISPNGRFTGNDSESSTWPPQLKNIKEVKNGIPSSSTPRTLSLQSSLLAPVESALESQDVITLLSDRFIHIGTTTIRQKWSDSIDGHLVTFFSYSNNQTVEVTVTRNAIQDIKTYDPSVFQPPLLKQEVEAAVEIAKVYWLEQGVAEVENLEGFAIQTFMPDEGAHYDVRMAYVTFHQNLTSMPELLTWVDLTNETVEKSVLGGGK